jgi:hypothetical protein
MFALAEHTTTTLIWFLGIPSIALAEHIWSVMKRDTPNPYIRHSRQHHNKGRK